MSPALMEQRCSHCLGWHAMACPRVSELHVIGGDSGRTIITKFWPPGWEKYYKGRILFLEDFDQEEDTE